MIYFSNKLMMWGLALNRKPVISGSERMFSARGSISKLNIIGESGQPCLVPLEIKNVFDNMFSVYTWANWERIRS